MRDAVKQRVYDSEYALRDLLEEGTPTMIVGGSTLHLRRDGRFKSLSEVQRYVNGVTGDPRVLATWGDVRPIEVIKRHGDAHAHYVAGHIAIPVESYTGWAWRELVVLHEVAHHLVREHYGYNVANHGVEFAATFARLLEIVLGGEVALVFTVLLSQNLVGDFWKPLAALRSRAVA